jgi:hypothetical protein
MSKKCVRLSVPLDVVAREIKHVARHYCRHCRTKLKVPVDNLHHAICSHACYSSFYRSRCLVCEEPLGRTSERQRFGSGHRDCAAEYERFPHVYDITARWIDP